MDTTDSPHDKTLTESETWPMQDLSSLATMYGVVGGGGDSNNSRHSEPVLNAVSSLDQLMNSFFSTVAPTTPTNPTPPPDFTSPGPTIQAYQRIKSVSMSESMNLKRDTDENETTDLVCFSLNDLANEYLAANPITHSEESSLVDLMKKRELNDQLDRTISTSAAADLNKSEISPKSTRTTKTPTTKLEFIRCEEAEINLVSSLFQVNSTIEADCRVPNSIGNSELEACFDFECQVAREREKCSKRRRIVVDDVGGGGKDAKARSTTTTTASGKSKSKSKSAKSTPNSTETNKIHVFDFSIPSPDDIIIAKQKFAFRNSRLK